jgi:hypothetical protein
MSGVKVQAKALGAVRATAVFCGGICVGIVTGVLFHWMASGSVWP